MSIAEVGIRIDPETGIAFFGMDEVNRRIAAGARVLELRPGGVVMRKTGEAAQERDLRDPITRSLVDYIRKVRSGTIPRPTRLPGS